MRSLVLCAATLALALTATTTDAHAKPDLGTKWVVNDSGWKGVWKRTRAGSNVFTGVFTHPKHKRVKTRLIITQGVGNKFTIRRTDTTGWSKGKGCTYKGTISADGKRVTGSSSCQWAKGPHPLSGKIIGQRYREFVKPMYPKSRTHRLDYRWAGKPVARKSPGRDPAIKFCKAMGYRTAIHWDKDSAAGVYKTAFIGTGQSCRKGNRCKGYRVIHCR